jgi:hypothetical protein
MTAPISISHLYKQMNLCISLVKNKDLTLFSQGLEGVWIESEGVRQQGFYEFFPGDCGRWGCGGLCLSTQFLIIFEL